MTCTYRLFALFLSVVVCASSADARTGARATASNRCLKYDSTVTLTGSLSILIGYKAPGFGETPNDPKSFVPMLTLDKPICVDANEATMSDEATGVKELEITGASDIRNRSGHPGDLRSRGLLGRHVFVRGTLSFALRSDDFSKVLIDVADPHTDISLVSPQPADDALFIISAFYRSLGGGDGETAVRFVVPEKRSSGPLSAHALSQFYGSLWLPLTLTEVHPLSPTSYLAHYGYTTHSGTACKGAAIVSVQYRDARPLISGIRANC